MKNSKLHSKICVSIFCGATSRFWEKSLQDYSAVCFFFIPSIPLIPSYIPSLSVSQKATARENTHARYIYRAFGWVESSLWWRWRMPLSVRRASDKRASPSVIQPRLYSCVAAVRLRKNKITKKILKNNEKKKPITKKQFNKNHIHIWEKKN